MLKPVLGSQLNLGSHLARGLVGCWLFNEGGGNKVFDLSGNGRTGTLVADTHWVPGKFGSALDFDGTGDYINVGSIGWSQAIGAPVTIVSWVKSDKVDYSVKAGVILANRSGSELFRLSTNVANPAKWRFVYDSLGDGGGIDSLSDVIANTWTQVVGVYDGVNLKIYINGLLEATLANKPSAQVQVDDVVISREASDQDDEYFFGLIDIPSVYNRALSAPEIANLYRAAFQI